MPYSKKYSNVLVQPPASADTCTSRELEWQPNAQRRRLAAAMTVATASGIVNSWVLLVEIKR